MEIRVIGPGCARCRKALEEARRAVLLAGVPAAVIKVDDLQELIAYGAMTTPAIVVNGVLRCTGRVARAAEIARWLIEGAVSGGGVR